MSTAMRRVELTPREEEICRFVGEDRRYHEIAESLGISPRTVHTHIEKAAAKIPGQGRARHKLIAYFFTHLVDD